MKATGIVRHVDDLGRVVIPKEIRRMFMIKEGDPIEVYVDKDCVILKKFDMDGDIEQTIDNFCRAIEFKSGLLTPAQQIALVSKAKEMKSLLAVDGGQR